MTKQTINVGTAANDKKGDSLRAAFQKVNANFTELYNSTYTPAVSGDWSGTTPTTVAAALDRIAAAIGPIA
jgi:hypothetical protein